MIKQYLKQAIAMLRENRLISAISVLGTALSIAMIMVVVLVVQIQVADYYPENKRSRMLFVDPGGTEIRSVENAQNWMHGSMSSEVVKSCFYRLETPEAVSAYTVKGLPASPMDRRNFTLYQVKLVDARFWQICSFRFLAGSAFSQADFDSGIRNAVISESLARTLFGDVQAVGKEFRLDLTPYRVCGVVPDVSKAADMAYADIWIPYTCDADVMRLDPEYENMPGFLGVVILAHDAADFPAIRAELAQTISQYNRTKRDYQVSFFQNPITQWDKARGSWAQSFVSWKRYVAETGGLLLFLLLVPALNLLGVTHSSIQKRQAEIGVRKAFGATNRVIIQQILCENGVISLLGGAIGFLLSFIALPLCKGFLLGSSDTVLSGEMLFQPAAFLLALLFCLVLNLLSAGLPAWWITRKPISDALKNEEEINK